MIHVGVTTMKRLDQGHLHPLLEHPETNMSRPGIEPVPPVAQTSTLELFEQLLLLLFRTSTALLYERGIAVTQQKWPPQGAEPRVDLKTYLQTSWPSNKNVFFVFN
jgi:hypothetical protein